MRTVLQAVRRIANEILGVKELICLLFYLISLKFCGSSLIEGNFPCGDSNYSNKIHAANHTYRCFRQKDCHCFGI